MLVKAAGQGVHWIRAATLDGNEVRTVLRYRGEDRAEPEATPVRWGEPHLDAGDDAVARGGDPRQDPRDRDRRLAGR